MVENAPTILAIESVTRNNDSAKSPRLRHRLGSYSARMKTKRKTISAPTLKPRITAE
jgi:hypothetical protein